MTYRDKIYKKDEYFLGDWCYVKMVLFKSKLNDKYKIAVIGRNDLIKENLRYSISYEELKFAKICYDNWKNIFIETPKQLEKELGEPKLKEKYMKTYMELWD